jgi:hypothetical protein
MDGLPAQLFVGEELGRDREALVDALIEADVPGVVPIVSPRERWGDLFLRTGVVGASRINFDDGETLDAFARQLGLLLDSAALLARAVAIERSLTPRSSRRSATPQRGSCTTFATPWQPLAVWHSS